MACLNWSEGFSVGIEMVDADHRQLLQLLNEADQLRWRLIKEGDVDISLVKDILDKLLEYTARHFAFEEALMKEFSYPDLEAHAQIHQNLIRSLLLLQKEFRKEGISILPKMIVFLSTWWSSHILSTDMEYSSYLELENKDIEVVDRIATQSYYQSLTGGNGQKN